MGRLVSLGDSFADVARDPRSYLRLLAGDLGLGIADGNPAVGASSLDHLFMKQWPQVSDTLQHGDLVIVSLTNPDRTFFFPDDHMLSMPACVDDEWMSRRPYTPYRWSRNERDALGMYYAYLHSDARNLSWLHSWFYQLDHTCRLIGIRAIVMDCFGGPGGTSSVRHPEGGSIIRASGSLSDISTMEVGDGKTRDYLARHVDPRINHMTLGNHRVMASKLLHALDGQDLDLGSGFNRGCFDVSMIADDGWFEDNIGDGHIDRRWLIERMREDEKDMG